MNLRKLILVGVLTLILVQAEASKTHLQRKAKRFRKEVLDDSVVYSLGGYNGRHSRSLSTIRSALNGELSSYIPTVNKLLATGGAPVANMFETFLPTFKKRILSDGPLVKTSLDNIMNTVLNQLAVPCDIMNNLNELDKQISPDVAAMDQEAINTLSTEVRKFGDVLDTFLKSIPNLTQEQNETTVKCLPKLDVIALHVANNPCMALCLVIDNTMLPVLVEAVKKQNLCDNGFLCKQVKKQVIKRSATIVCDAIKEVPERIGSLVSQLQQDVAEFDQCLAAIPGNDTRLQSNTKI